MGCEYVGMTLPPKDPMQVATAAAAEPRSPGNGMGPPGGGSTAPSALEPLRPPTDPGWQGLPSRTRTGTATRRGDGSGLPAPADPSRPFSCRARFVL